MAEMNEKRLSQIFTRLICRNQELDPISLGEKLAERAMEEFDLAEPSSGIRVIDPETSKRDTPTDFDEIRKVRPPSPPSPTPKKEKSMIIMPEDPEFQAAANMTEAERRGLGPKGTATQGLRLTKITPSEGSNLSPRDPVRHFSVETLIAKANEFFPQEIWFTPDGMDPNRIQVQSVRNVRAIIQNPCSGISVEYANPDVSGDRGETDPSTGQLGTVVIGLTASCRFWETDEIIDVEAAMESILIQLKGLYKPRSKQTVGVDIGPSPMDSWNAFQPGMKDADSIRGERNWSSVGANRREVQVGGQTFYVSDPLPSMVERVMQTNSQSGNPNERR